MVHATSAESGLTRIRGARLASRTRLVPGSKALPRYGVLSSHGDPEPQTRRGCCMLRPEAPSITRSLILVKNGSSVDDRACKKASQPSAEGTCCQWKVDNLATAKENWHSPLPGLGPAIAAWPGTVAVGAPASIHAAHNKPSWKSVRSRPHSSSVRSPLPAVAHHAPDWQLPLECCQAKMGFTDVSLIQQLADTQGRRKNAQNHYLFVS